MPFTYLTVIHSWPLGSSVRPLRFTPRPQDYCEANPGPHLIPFVNISGCLAWFISVMDRRPFLMFCVLYFLVQLLISIQCVKSFFHCYICKLIWLRESLTSFVEMKELTSLPRGSGLSPSSPTARPSLPWTNHFSKNSASQYSPHNVFLNIFNLKES